MSASGIWFIIGIIILVSIIFGVSLHDAFWGIVAFVTNNTALELSIGVFGIGYESVKQVKNQIETGKTTSSNMNFKVNLLSIGFGVSFYL